MKLSVVSTLYCSPPYVGEFDPVASGAAEAVTSNISVENDDSPDESLNLVGADVAMHLSNAQSRRRPLHNREADSWRITR